MLPLRPRGAGSPTARKSAIPLHYSTVRPLGCLSKRNSENAPARRSTARAATTSPAGRQRGRAGRTHRQRTTGARAGTSPTAPHGGPIGDRPRGRRWEGLHRVGRCRPRAPTVATWTNAAPVVAGGWRRVGARLEGGADRRARRCTESTPKVHRPRRPAICQTHTRNLPTAAPPLEGRATFPHFSAVDRPRAPLEVRTLAACQPASVAAARFGAVPSPRPAPPTEHRPRARGAVMLATCAASSRARRANKSSLSMYPTRATARVTTLATRLPHRGPPHHARRLEARPYLCR